MYHVMQNGKPAKYPEHTVDSSWDNCDFINRDEAVEYAQNWLGYLAPNETYWTVHQKYEFYDSVLEIIKINDGDETGPKFYGGGKTPLEVSEQIDRIERKLDWIKSYQTKQEYTFNNKKWPGDLED